MRNLQKILALALALIMSFSLVVTANAAFSDEADINETYSEAVNVLSGLEVFRGYTDGSYQPQASITRAEVAAIIYRIATGDVEDRQVSLYSDYNRFTDVASGSWYAGYVNYCANAEYIQGYGDGRFGPNDPVTGYQALAMILRAVGYGKMNEFTGSNWAVQTAARANTLKISRNVTAALLGSPASREVVAELLFRSILVPTVDYNQFNGYTETDTNLAANLGLEAVKGVVVANQEADLYSEEVMAEGKTNLEVAENDIRTLDYTTTLDDIGESRYAYIVDSKVLALGDTGENVKFETGDDTDVSTDKKFKDKSGLSRSEDTEFYLNFGREGHFSCDQRLEFTVVFYNATAEASFDEAYEDVSKYAYARKDTDNDWTVELGTLKTPAPSDGDKYNWSPIGNVSDYEIANNKYPIRYNRVIRAEEEITAEEMNILQGIFAAADNDPENGKDKDKLTGDVYVGTKSTSDKVTDEERDLSNSISFRKFKDEYINSEAWDRNFEGNDRGEWLKIVDCDNDGTADYAFLTEYHLDEVTGTYTKSGETKYEYEVLDVEDWDVVDYVDEVEVGTVVLTTEIDNKVTIKKAEILTDKIQTVSFRDETVTTVGGETKKQSEINNDTRMDETITNMDDGVEYNMYLDRFGHIRAYELAAGTKYALLTELYYDRFNNSQYVTNHDLIAEVKAGEAKTEEFDVLNSKGNDFVMSLVDNNKNVETWQNLYTTFGAKGSEYLHWRDAYVTSDRSNDQELRERIVLQPAINNMALETQSKRADDIFENASTNIARYVQTDEGVRITTAAEYAHDKKNNERLYYGRTGNSEPYGVDYTKRYTEKEWKDEFGTVANIPAEYAVYKYNYIELDCWDGITADQRHYDIAGARTAPGVVHEADGQWRNYSGDYVNAVHDTEYYIVNRNSGKIDYFTDYDNVKKIDAELIEAVYAVAENTEADSNARDYWVADVIVIEVNGWNGDVDNISLVFDNFQQTSQRVKFLDTLTTKYEGVNAHVIPGDGEWGTRWQDIDFGFYMLLDAEKDGDELVADDIKEIKSNFAKYGIKAGVVTRVDEVSSRGGYIDVDLHDADNSITRDISVDNGRAYLPDDRNAVYAIDGSEAVDGLHVSNNDNGDLRVGDQIIWVEKADDSKTVYFIVVVSDKADSHKHDWNSPAWLENLYEDIIIEQRTGEAPEKSEVDKLIAESTNTVKGPIKTKAERDAAQAMLARLEEMAAKETITVGDLNKLEAEITRIEALIDTFDTGVSSAESAANEAKNALNADLEKYKDLVGATDWADKVAVAKEYTKKLEEATSVAEVNKIKQDAQIAMADEWGHESYGDVRDKIMSTPEIRADLVNKKVYVDASSASDLFTISKDAELTVDENIALIGWWLGVEATYADGVYTANRDDDTFIYNANLTESSVEDKQGGGKTYKNPSILYSIYSEANYLNEAAYFFIFFNETTKFDGDSDPFQYYVSKRLSLDDIDGTKTWSPDGGQQIEFVVVKDWPELG